MAMTMFQYPYIKDVVAQEQIITYAAEHQAWQGLKRYAIRF